MEMEVRYNLKNVLQNIAKALRQYYELEDNKLINPQDFSEMIFGVSLPYLSENMVDKTGSGSEVINYVKISDSITSLDAGAFKTLINIKSIYIGANITTIGESCFEGCTSLQKVELNNSQITSLPSKLFYQCTSLSEITPPVGLKSISDEVFYACSSLTSFEIPESVTKIGRFAFGGSGITNIYIHKNIISINSNPFTLCRKIERITVSEDNVKYDSRDNCNAIIETASNTLICKLPVSTIPDTVKALGPYAYYKTVENEIIVPPQITSIGSYCFSQSSYVISIDMSNCNVEVLPTAVFYISPELKEIKFPPRLRIISSSIFYSNMKVELLDFRNYAGDAPPILEGSLSGAGTKYKIVIPNNAELKEAWKNASNWSNYADRILTLDEYNSLANT